MKDVTAALAWEVRPLDVAGDWEGRWELFRRQVGGNVLLRSLLARRAAGAFAIGNIHFCVAADCSGVAAMALALPARPGVWRLFNTSQLPLGFWLQRDDVDLVAAVGALQRSLPGVNLLFEALHLDPELVPRPPSEGGVRVVDYILTGAVSIPATVEQFFGQLEKKKLYEVTRRERRATEEVGAPRLECLADGPLVRAAIADYSRIESSGWKAAGGTALEVGGAQSAFYEDFLEELASHGEARVYKLYFGDRLAAMQLAALAPPTLVFLKTCHDEALGRYGPGVLLKKLIFESLIADERGVRNAEFYGPYNDSQRLWVSGTRRMFHVNCYRTPAMAKLHRLARGGASSWRRLHRLWRRPSPTGDTHGGRGDPAGARESPSSTRCLTFDPQQEAFPQLPAAAFGETKSPFHSLPWIRLLASSALPGGRQVFLIAAQQPEGGLLLPMACQRGANRIDALISYYTPLFEPLTHLAGPALERAVEAAVDELVAVRRWAIVDFHPLDPELEFAACCERVLRARGFLVGRYNCAGNWVADVEDLDGAAYMAKRTRLRGSIRRSAAKLRAEAAVDIRVLTRECPELEEDIQGFTETYRKSWRVPEPSPDFVSGLCRVAAREGWLRLGTLRVSGTVAASQIWLVLDGVAYIFKIAYAEPFARHSVGSILTQHMMEYVLDVDRVRLIDYLVGDDDYKKRWMDRRRQRIGIVAFNPRTVKGLLAAGRHFGGVFYRRAVERLQAGSQTQPARDQSVL